MSIDQLLDELTAELQPVKPRHVHKELLLLVVIGTIELGLFFLFGAARSDLSMAIKLPSFWWKIGSLGLITVLGAGTVLRSLDPTQSTRHGLRLIVGLVCLTLLLGWAIDTSRPGADTLWARLTWRSGINCVFAVVALSVPAIATLGLLMRRGAPTDLEGSGLAIGMTSATWGAFVFVFNCPHADPFYVAVWYSVGCTIVTLFGRLALPSINRW